MRNEELILKAKHEQDVSLQRIQALQKQLVFENTKRVKLQGLIEGLEGDLVADEPEKQKKEPKRVTEIKQPKEEKNNASGKPDTRAE